MKKTLLFAMFFLLSTLSLRAGENTELRFCWWGGSERHETTLAVIKLFEEQNPGVTIKPEYMGWSGYVERLTTQIGAGAEPDIMQINWAWIDMFSPKGDGLYDLNKVKDNLNLAAFTDDMIASGISNGALNGLPVSMTTRFFIWNKTMWDKAGAPLPKTWDDLIDAGAKFKAMGDKYYATDLEPIEGLYMLDAYLYEKFGQQIIHPTEPKIGLDKEQLAVGIEWFKAMMDSHSAVSAPVRTSAGGQYDRPSEQVAEYVNGDWAGTFVWNSMLDLRTVGPIEKGFDMVLGDFLTLDGKNPKPDRIGRPAMMLAVGKNSKHPELAAKFISFFLTNPDAASALGLARGIPVAKPAYDRLLQEGRISAMNLDAEKQLDGARIVYTSPLFEHERIRSLLLEILEGVSFNKLPPDQAADQIIREGSRRIRRLDAAANR
jgi:ABC-type sugar transport system, periplasmic component